MPALFSLTFQAEEKPKQRAPEPPIVQTVVDIFKLANDQANQNKDRYGSDSGYG